MTKHPEKLLALVVFTTLASFTIARAQSTPASPTPVATPTASSTPDASATPDVSATPEPSASPTASAAADKWEFYKDKTAEWRWRHWDGNGNEIGAATEGYKNLADCEQNAKRNGFQ
jgi:uncharacterized protein YegP (UPF0339 family)